MFSMIPIGRVDLMFSRRGTTVLILQFRHARGKCSNLTRTRRVFAFC